MKKQIIMIALTMILGTLSYSLMAQELASSKMNMDMKLDKKMMEYVDVDPTFQKQLTQFFLVSLELNEAFMKDDVEMVKSASTNVKSQIGKVDMMLLTSKTHMEWLKYLKTMYSGLRQISSASTIEDQRTAFARYSQGLYYSIEAFGIDIGSYYQYCPMANNMAGAYWLSDSKEIRNPYLGSKMPPCGDVIETIN